MKVLRYSSFLTNLLESNLPDIQNGYIRKGAINTSGYTNVIAENEFPNDYINKNLVDDLDKAGKMATLEYEGKVHNGVMVQITCGKTDHPKNPGYTSAHDAGQAVDIALLAFMGGSYMGSNKSNQYSTDNNPTFVALANAVVEQLIGLGYKLVTHDKTLKQKFKDYLAYGESKNGKFVLWRGHFGKGGNHYNHIHVSNKEDSPSTYQEPQIAAVTNQDQSTQQPQLSQRDKNIANNNPGNIRYNPELLGCVGDVNGFCRFESLGYGYRAILVLLNTYYDKYNLSTIKDILYRYCPPTQCDTEGYIRLLSSESGFSPSQKLNKEDLVRLVPGIAKQENSIDISLEEVVHLINQTEDTKIAIEDSVTKKGEYSSIFTPIESEGDIPFYIIYPSSETISFMDDIIVQDFDDWTEESGIVFADDKFVTINEIIFDIEQKLEDSSNTMGEFTLILCDESIRKEIFEDLEYTDKMKNLVLINPKPNSDIIPEIAKVAQKAEIFVGYNSVKLSQEFGQEPTIKFFLDLKKQIRLSTEGTELGKNIESNFKDYKEIDDMSQLAKTTLMDFKTRIEFVS